MHYQRWKWSSSSCSSNQISIMFTNASPSPWKRATPLSCYWYQLKVLCRDFLHQWVHKSPQLHLCQSASWCFEDCLLRPSFDISSVWCWRRTRQWTQIRPERMHVSQLRLYPGKPWVSTENSLHFPVSNIWLVEREQIHCLHNRSSGDDFSIEMRKCLFHLGNFRVENIESLLLSLLSFVVSPFNSNHVLIDKVI